MSQLYEYYNTGDTGAVYLNGINVWAAQMISVDVAHKVTSVKLKAKRVGSPGDITVSIRATSAGKPTGADLCVGTYNCDVLGTVLEKWFEVSLGSGYSFEAGLYAIVFRHLNYSSGNYVLFRSDSTSPTYDGQSCLSVTSGASWLTPSDSRDYMFEEWGERIVTDDEVRDLTLRQRSLELSLLQRSQALAVKERSLAMTLQGGVYEQATRSS